MAKYNSIAVIYGSDSSEWEVACRSGEFTASRIDDMAYDVYEIFARFGKWSLVAFRKKNSMRVTLPEGARPEIDKTDFSVRIYGEKVKFDYAYIMQHGAPGETGLLQGYFEMLGVPFGIVDLSLAPTPAIGDSVAYILMQELSQGCGFCEVCSRYVRPQGR